MEKEISGLGSDTVELTQTLSILRKLLWVSEL